MTRSAIVILRVSGRRGKLESKGFYRRRAASMGHFFDLEEIEKLDPLKVTDVMRNLPGVYVRRSRLGGAVALTHRFGRNCPMKVVLDGFTVEVADGSLDDLVNPDPVIRMEVYPSGMGAPVQH